MTGAAHESRHHGNENTDASELANRGWSVPSGAQREKCQKLWTGEVLPLDGSLLMGDSWVRRERCLSSQRMISSASSPIYLFSCCAASHRSWCVSSEMTTCLVTPGNILPFF